MTQEDQEKPKPKDITPESSEDAGEDAPKPNQTQPIPSATSTVATAAVVLSYT